MTQSVDHNAGLPGHLLVTLSIAIAEKMQEMQRRLDDAVNAYSEEAKANYSFQSGMNDRDETIRKKTAMLDAKEQTLIDRERQIRQLEDRIKEGRAQNERLIESNKELERKVIDLNMEIAKYTSGSAIAPLVKRALEIFDSDETTGQSMHRIVEMVLTEVGVKAL